MNGLAWVAFVAVAGAVSVAACSSSSSRYSGPVGEPTMIEKGGDDAASDVVAAPEAAPPSMYVFGDAAACDPTHPFTSVPWAPPTQLMGGSGFCDGASLSNYLTCFRVGFTSAGCDATKISQACRACIETDVGAPLHGPVVTETQNGVINILEVNFGGCLASFDHDVSATSCGAKTNDANDCLVAECGNCYQFPAGPESAACAQTAFNYGPCASHKTTPACEGEVVGAGDAGTGMGACLDLANLLPLWCPPPPPPPDAGDAEAGSIDAPTG